MICQLFGGLSRIVEAAFPSEHAGVARWLSHLTSFPDSGMTGYCTSCLRRNEFCRFVGQEQGSAVDIPEPSVEMLRPLGRHGGGEHQVVTSGALISLPCGDQ